MKKLLILSIAMISSIFTTPMLGMFATAAKTSFRQHSRQAPRCYSQKKSNIQPTSTAPTTIREYLQQEEEKIFQKLGVLEKEFKKTVTKESSKLEYLPEEMQILYAVSNKPQPLFYIYFAQEAIKLLDEYITKTAPFIMRQELLGKMCDGMDYQDPTITEKDRVEHCLQVTADFIKKVYVEQDSPEDRVIVEEQFKRIEQEINNLVSSQ